MAIKTAIFHDCRYFLLICLISAAVTYKGYHSQSDRLSSKFVLRGAAIILGDESSIQWGVSFKIWV